MQIFSLLLASTVLCCTPQASTSSIAPAVELSTKTVDANYAILTVKSINADGVSVLLSLRDAQEPDARTVQAQGAVVDGKTITLENLIGGTDYTAYAVAYTTEGRLSSVANVKFRTAGGTPTLYSWEKERGSSVPWYSNMALCYGGSAHRSPFTWTQDRFQKHVSYVDENGKEHWLFDAFLAIEFAMTQDNMDIALGYGRPQADKACWQKLIDYWFDEGTGFDALEAAVTATAQRIGPAPTSRKVVMVMPDACMYKNIVKTSSGSLDMEATQATGTKYWGQLNGTTLDFSKPADRLAALEWYIDQVRAKWNEKGYQNLELIGFYTVSEDLAIPGDGWSSEIKAWEDIYPAISYYVHSCNESMSWIPYYKAAGYKRWKENGFDHVQMQPNYFWNTHPTYTEKEYNEMVTTYDLSMELEMDSKMLSSQNSTDADFYKTRFRHYMDWSKSLGFYGKRELSYYMGGNDMYNLATSPAESDVELYHEFCQFLLGHIH